MPRSRPHHTDDTPERSPDEAPPAPTPDEIAAATPTDDYPERTLKEASEGVVSFNPGSKDPAHQKARLEHGSDYVPTEAQRRPGYNPPKY